LIFYIIPLATTVGSNNQQVTAPKYAATDLLNLSYSALPYGAEGVALVSLASPNAMLAAEVDVYAFPADLTQTLGITDRTTLVAYAQAHNIPNDWIAFGATFQSVLTRMAQIFLCMHAIFGATGTALCAGTQNTPATPLAQAAIALPVSGPFNFSKANATATLGDILVSVGQQFAMNSSGVSNLTPTSGAVTTTPVNPVTQPVGGLN
jgi:hypothetical protein